MPARISDGRRASACASWPSRPSALAGCSGLARADFFVDGDDGAAQRAQHDARLHAARASTASSGTPPACPTRSSASSSCASRSPGTSTSGPCGGELAGRHPALRALPPRRPGRQRRHVDGLPGLRHGARAPGGDQAHAPRDRRRTPTSSSASGARRAPSPSSTTRTSSASSTPARTTNMPYIVFEFVEGETLKDRIRRAGRLPIGEAVAYAIEIARALGAAHDRAHRAPRRQAPERPDRRGGRRARHRLRHRPHADRGGPDGRRARAGHHRLRLARAGARPAGRPARATSTRSASCCSRCSPATCPSTARTRSRWR